MSECRLSFLFIPHFRFWPQYDLSFQWFFNIIIMDWRFQRYSTT